jgi:hypothetical protein
VWLVFLYIFFQFCIKILFELDRWTCSSCVFPIPCAPIPCALVFRFRSFKEFQFVYFVCAYAYMDGSHFTSWTDCMKTTSRYSRRAQESLSVRELIPVDVRKQIGSLSRIISFTSRHMRVRNWLASTSAPYSLITVKLESSKRWAVLLITKTPFTFLY